VDVVWQPDLFAGAAGVTVDETFAGARRVALDATSWVEVVPGWLSGANALFDRLAETVPWKQHYRELFDQTFLEPRLTAEYRDLGLVPHPGLVAAAEALSVRYGVRYDGVWLNLYRDGRDSTGWHRDRFACRGPESVVPVLTLGATRRFQVRPHKGGASVTFRPAAGDLVVMGGRGQRDWVHGVPKTPGPVGARISVNFQSSEQAQAGPRTVLV
jgi:alkylated DNA repair dioxygenase AlkB